MVNMKMVNKSHVIFRLFLERVHLYVFIPGEMLKYEWDYGIAMHLV